MTTRDVPRFAVAAQALTAPPLLVAGVALLVACAWLLDVAAIWQRAEALRQRTALARMRAAAETVAMRAAQDDAANAEVELVGVHVAVRRAGDELSLACEVGHERVHFVAAALPGGGPPALGLACGTCDATELECLGGGRALGRDAWPLLDSAVVAAAPRAEAMRGFRPDQGVALHFLRAGTDRDDFVWTDGRSPTTTGGVLVVPGHLWVEPGSTPLRLPLMSDLTLVVEGNLYLGRSVEVLGPGRLLVVTTAPAASTVFADLDGSGGWSAGDRLRDATRFSGPIEGGGSAFVGLGDGGAGVARVAFGLVVAGELHLRGSLAVDGPLLLRGGVTTLLRGAADVHANGVWAYRPERERIPGFATTGPARAGMLRRVDESVLYLASPAR